MTATGRPGLRAVIFDAGDTLIRMPRRREEILIDLCLQLGESIPLDRASEACHWSERYYVRNYLGDAGDRSEFWRRYHGEALRYLGIEDPSGEKADLLSHGFGRAGVWTAFPEAAGVCGRLKALGLKLAVVSNGPDTVVQLLSQAGLLPFFDAVITSQTAGIEKPDPRIFALALGRLNVSPGDALFAGDLYEVDVLGARSAGMAAVLIDRRDSPDARDCPVIRSLDQLIPMVGG
jgi:putative hydrolase of the HAD superfamily